jgi:hypothetical protein
VTPRNGLTARREFVDNGGPADRREEMTGQGKFVAWAITLTILDLVTPFVPLLGIVVIFIAARRPAWFADAVRDLYGSA